MKLRHSLLIAAAVVAVAIGAARADLTYTQGSGTTIFDFVCFSTKHCSAHVPVTSAGVEIVPSTAALQTTGNTSLATIATNSALPLPAQTGIGNVNIGAVQNAGSKYIAVAASATATVLQASAGAAGDYLSHCVLYPTSTSPGVVTVFDNTNTAATSAILFPGGTSSTSNLTPISVPVGAVSTAGAWKVTTGANVSVVCYGKFS